MSIRTFTLTIGKVYNGEVECTTPHVELAGKQHIAVNCIDPKGCRYSVQLGPNDIEPCLTFLVTCEECGPCGTKVITKCFCDSVDDCESCEICDTDGFCFPTCPDGICTEGICYECNEEVNCPCNRICQNGGCTCPPGSTLNANGCCDECQKDSDCPYCDTCIDKGSHYACEPKECNCDSTGKCGTKGECVECTNSGHCPENEVCDIHCECQCAPGYTRINGICTPTDCPNGDEDCPVCEICVGTVCVPNQCPVGKVPVDIDGVCSCVEECNCEQPNCSSRFSFCGESSIAGRCGCQPCTGNCDDGCDDPCICDENLNKCKFNPCFGSCESGLDCGPTCGCKDGECVPCDILDCDSSECADALGCVCSSIRRCVKDTCDSTPCSVSADCEIGCTCDGGVCNACSNYSCNTDDCSEHDGCVCSGGHCVGDEDPECNDTITIEKDDAVCEITGTLVKEKCCQCPAITLDVKTISAVDKGTTAKTVKYKTEVRKGKYDGVSVDSNPLVDNFDSPAIAENEPPISGTIRLNYSISYKIFNIVNGKDVATGLSSVSNQPAKQVSYTGDVSQKEISVDLPRIGVRTVSGNQALVVEFIELTFSLETKMIFPNNCEYPAGTEIGEIKITSNDGFLKAPIGNTITSDDCRLPFIKWTKFPLGSTVGDVFRKIYLDETDTNTFIDVIDGDLGAESCFTYLFEPDCACDDPASDYIVFCNPVFNKPELENCGKRAKIDIDASCLANQNKDFELYVNGVVVKTFKLNVPQVFDWDSVAPIISIKLHMKCDVPGECDTEYTYPENNIDPVPQGSCKADGTVTFTFDAASYPGGISSIVFDGELKTSNFVYEGKDPDTDYDYQVTFSNGCVSDEKTINWSCCITPTLECSTGGKYHVVTSSSGVKYNGIALPANHIITPPATGTAPLTYVCDGVTKTLTIYPYSQYQPCCNIVLSTFTIDADAKTITIAIGTTSTSGNYSVSVKRTTGAILSSTTMTNNAATHTFTVTSDVDENLVVEVKNADTFCVKTYPVSFDADGCDLGLELSVDDDACVLTASTDEKTCYCPAGKISGSVSAVTELPNNKLSATFAITPTITDSSGKDIVSSSLQIYVNGVIANTETLYSLTPAPITRTIDAFCIATSNETVVFTAVTELCESGCAGQTHNLQVSIPNPYIVTGITIGSNTFSPLSHVDGDPWDIHYSPSGSTSIIISFTNTDTSLTYTSGPINAQTLQSQSYTLDVSTSDCYLCGGTIKGANIKLLYAVTLEDGCIYTGELTKQICVGTTSTLTEVALTNTNPTGKKMQFDLYDGVTLLQTDYKKGPSSVNYGADDIDFKPGTSYDVVSTCDCEETATFSDCFETTITKYEPTGYVWGSNCNKKYGVTIQSCYHGEKVNLTLGGTTQVITLDSDGTGNATFDLPTSLTTTDVAISYSYQVNGSGAFCSSSTTIENDFVPEHTVSYNCTDGTNDEYTATISVAGGGTVLITSVPSGAQYGTISGASLVDVTSTNHFSVQISINGSCTYTIPIFADCSCNIKTATVANPVIDICAFREGAGSYATNDKSLAITAVTRTDSGNDWWTALGANTIGSGHTGTSLSLSISGSELLTAAPSAGANSINLNLADTDGGTPCIIIPLTINRTNVQYTPTASCGSGTWSVSVASSTSPITLSANSAGTISGTNINNIPLSTLSVTFRVNKGTCISSLVTVTIPDDCSPACENSEISFTNTLTTNPCSITNSQGSIRVSVITSNVNCPITSVTGAGQVSSYFSGGYWYITYADDAIGSKTITASTNCGCSRQTIVALAQDCCNQNESQQVSITVSPDPFCDTGSAVSVSVFNPYGYEIEDWAISTGSWNTGPSDTGGIITVPGGQSQLTVSVYVRDTLGNSCNYISKTVYAIECSVDLCTGHVCPDCQFCQTGVCIPDPSLQALQGPCDPGDVCCGGYCTVECAADADSYDSGCTYNHEVCASDCGSPVNTTPDCITSITNLTLGSFTCSSGVCYATGSVTITKNSVCPAFDAFNITENVVPIFLSCSSSTAYGIYVTGGTIVGNTMTVELTIASCFDPEDFSTCNNIGCGQTLSGGYSIVLTGEDPCCVPLSITLSDCGSCAAC